METSKYIQMAIETAEKGLSKGNGPFGAVIVREGQVIAAGANSVTLNHDPTAHAEVLAIREAASKLGTHDLSDCVLYASCEPCPMCLGAIYWAGIKKVFYASTRMDAEKAGFDDKLIYNELSLAPEERSIECHHLSDKRADELFERWQNLDDKIPY